ncbi:type II toxin-antitoxin system PemK/MazF family toxin [Aquirufa ecclesiirivi]|uniref:Type II toxin-antitoxin system PemK/MazF family toxin n=1 Tax=Aquirufa ecclesiirivi TaxID=2715124 RepID=A0ABT4JEN8_9BACT|nr:type II toxin-antitoxin system PemK/MazF family toxin [Aquirufa ecclesiirivi]MCZ2474738.1 type II toxin-antitoxin system PemK/MazF family toxin [Aquirufa ecclesiirivi]
MLNSKPEKYPTRVKIKHQGTPGWIVLDQIRTIDRKRIIKTMEFLEVDQIAQIKKIVQETFVD